MSTWYTWFSDFLFISMYFGYLKTLCSVQVESVSVVLKQLSVAK